MKPFETMTAPAAPLDLANVNTDQIFPARFIRKPRAVGYAGFAFHDLRFAEDGAARPGFVLNQAAFRGAGILVADANFGCGSSREGAVYALQDFGLGVVIAPSFGDIFAANCLKNGLLTVRLAPAPAAELRGELHAALQPEMTVDLAAQRITRPGGATLGFEIEAFDKQCLLEGLNEIDLSLRHDAEIAAFEAAYRDARPWLFRPPGGGR